MGDLAVGLSKTVVAGVLTKVQSVIDQGMMLRPKAQRDLVIISLEFEMMNSFLNSADEDRATNNNMVMTWVRHVRELAYDLENWIFIQFDLRISLCQRLRWCMVGSLLELDQAEMEIEEFKGRAEELSKSYSHYSNLSEPSSKLGMLHQAAGEPSSHMLADARDATRRLQGLGGLTHLISNKDNEDPCLQVISVWGTGGDLGRTSIIRKAYTDPEICQNFDCRSWVKLMHPFNPREFVRRFMAQVYANACKEEGADVGVYVLTKMEAAQEDLLSEFVKEVNTKTYLVVLENLTDMADWDAVRTFLPDMKKHSWIIVSTQQFEIASLCIGHSYRQTELKRFSPDHSVFAFFKQGSQDYGDKGAKLALSDVGQISSYRNIPSPIREAAMYWMENNPLVGRETELHELLSYTARAYFKGSQVISVCGIAGIGKSALIRNLYYERMLHSTQFQEYRWVDVSHPFNLRDFYRNLLLGHHSEKDPVMECHKLLSQRRCLIIIDDLWSKEEWDSIQAAMLSRSYASVIIVITTDANVATYCANNEEQVFKVNVLEDSASMDLFRSEVLRKEPLSPLNVHVDFELDELVLKCGGIPKVIVSLATLLTTQTITMKDNIVRSMNQRFMHHIETNPEFSSLLGLFSWIHQYFNACADSLMSCIFYLSFFPPHYNIRRRGLIRRWIAEDYCIDRYGKSAEEQGEELFSKLHDLSIIKKIHRAGTTLLNETRMSSFQANVFIHQYIVSRRTEENLVFQLGHDSVLTTKLIVRHLIILRSWDRDKIEFGKIDFSQLRSMTVFGIWESFFISESMKLIWVLDLENALGVKDEDLKTMVRQMHRLKFLSLRGQSQISRLPNSLGNLRQLQTLDVRHTSILRLPVSIGKLRKLQYIRAGTNVSASTPHASSSNLPEVRIGGLVGVKVPRGIGKLTALHTLGVINVSGSGGKAIVRELMKLTQLRKLGVSGVNKQNSKEFLYRSSGLIHLESLLVQLDNDSQGCLDYISLPWANLQSLKLYGLKDELPLSRTPLSKLRKLDLEMDTLQKDSMNFLAKLPNLCILHLRVKQLQPEDGKLRFNVYMHGLELDTFEKVKILEVTSRSSTLHIIFGSKSMKNLEQLKIDCSSASYNLAGLNHLSELKEVVINGIDDEAIKTNLERQLANHPKAPTVKLA